jgi:predicted transcriptional regulator
MKDISLILKPLGLLDSEVKTYLAALENGAGTVVELAKRTRLSRQATYVAIGSLTDRGLMSSVLQGKKRTYAAEHPDTLLAYAKRHEADLATRIKDLARAIPELALQAGGERPVVRVLEGKEGLRAYMADVSAERPKRIDEITDIDAMRKTLELEDLRPVRTTLGRVGSHVRALYTHAGATSPTQPNAERYQLPKELAGFKADVTIYGDKVALVTFEGKMYTVMIENRALAAVLRTLFELAFREAKRSLDRI